LAEAQAPENAGLTIDAVTKRFGGKTAVDRLSLTVREGEFAVLLGPSGCGKSTLLRVVAGLEAPDSGSVRMGGRDITALEPKDRDLAMVFQSYALYPHMTAGGNIAYPLKIRKRPAAEVATEVKRLAARLGLDDLLDRYPRALSGGQRQRVALARAIVRRPKAFLMDEPLSNLDARLRVEMRAELKHLQHELGIVTLYVTHDQAEAMTLASRIAVINEGKLLQFDTPWNVYHRPANLFVAGFLGSPSMNFLQGTHPAVTLPAALSARPHITAGVRPEDVEVSLAPQPGWCPARVYVIEAMGNESFLRLQADAAQITARVPAGMAVDFDQSVWFRLRPDKLHFFDPQTTEAVRCD
jgi:multiple sugar transport system ATP-binding protein